MKTFSFSLLEIAINPAYRYFAFCCFDMQNALFSVNVTRDGCEVYIFWVRVTGADK